MTRRSPHRCWPCSSSPSAASPADQRLIQPQHGGAQHGVDPRAPAPDRRERGDAHLHGHHLLARAASRRPCAVEGVTLSSGSGARSRASSSGTRPGACLGKASAALGRGCAGRASSRACPWRFRAPGGRWRGGREPLGPKLPPELLDHPRRHPLAASEPPEILLPPGPGEVHVGGRGLGGPLVRRPCRPLPRTGAAVPARAHRSTIGGRSSGRQPGRARPRRPVSDRLDQPLIDLRCRGVRGRRGAATRATCSSPWSPRRPTAPTRPAC